MTGYMGIASLVERKSRRRRVGWRTSLAVRIGLQLNVPLESGVGGRVGEREK